MTALWLLPMLLQGTAIVVDEVHFHKRRELPLWERIGHPIDTLVFLGCLSLPVLCPYTHDSFLVYLGISLFSCMLITKDEWVHTRFCTAQEHWLHSVLFILHPIILLETLLLWGGAQAFPELPLPDATREILLFQCIGILSFLILQIFNGVTYGSNRIDTKIQD